MVLDLDTQLPFVEASTGLLPALLRIARTRRQSMTTSTVQRLKQVVLLEMELPARVRSFPPVLAKVCWPTYFNRIYNVCRLKNSCLFYQRLSTVSWIPVGNDKTPF